ncbi:Uncharacterized protein APZ42_002434, partial [Daphnia magna]
PPLSLSLSLSFSLVTLSRVLSYRASSFNEVTFAPTSSTHRTTQLDTPRMLFQSAKINYKHFLITMLSSRDDAID